MRPTQNTRSISRKTSVDRSGEPLPRLGQVVARKHHRVPGLADAYRRGCPSTNMAFMYALLYVCFLVAPGGAWRTLSVLMWMVFHFVWSTESSNGHHFTRVSPPGLSGVAASATEADFHEVAVAFVDQESLRPAVLETFAMIGDPVGHLEVTPPDSQSNAC